MDPQPEMQASNETSPELAALKSASVFLGQQDINAAEQILSPFEAKTNRSATLVFLARISALRNENERALALLDRAEAISPFDRDAWEAKADLLMLQRKVAEELVYRRKLAYTDARPPARVHLALLRAFVAASQSGMDVPLTEIRLASRKLSEAPELTPEMELLFALSLYPVKKMVKEAAEHYRHARPCPKTHQDVSAEWMETKIWCERTGLRFHCVEHLGEDAPPGTHQPFIAELEQALLHPDFQGVPLVSNGKVALTGYHPDRLRVQVEDPTSLLLLQNSRTVEYRLPREVQEVVTAALFIGGGSPEGQSVSALERRLATATALGVDPSIPLVISGQLTSFQQELLSSLGFPSERLLQLSRDRITRFNRLIVSQTPVPTAG